VVFELLSKRIQIVLKEFNFNKPTAPQILAIPLILQRKNVLIISPTGTGKTEAALLPSFDLIHSYKGKGISLLYITPLRSLNRDLIDRISLWCSKLDLRSAVRHGDTSASERRRQALMPPDILITTPETLQILLISKIMKEHLKNVKILIIDEVHELAEDKRGSQLSIAIQRLRNLSNNFQIIGLSATVGEPEKLAKFLVGNDEGCEIANASEERKMKIKVFYPSVDEEDFKLSSNLLIYPDVISRLRKIKELSENRKACLVFTNTRTEAEVLGSRLRLLNLNFYVHHSSLSKDSRTFAETSLKTGKIRGIVCTSSLELGIDIGNIDYVIQYNSPRQVTRLVQRIGRSGHFVKGIAEGGIIPANIDSFFESYVIVEDALKGNYEKIDIPEKPLDVLAHQIVGVLIDKNKVSVEELLLTLKKAYPFRNITLNEIEDVISLLENIKPKPLIKDGNIIIRASGSLGYYISNLSMIPDQVQFSVINDKGEYIGELDESFVAEYGEEGIKFVLKGEVWEITNINEDEKIVKCKMAEDILGAIPSWVGEEIPVTKEIAIKAANLRNFVYNNLDNYSAIRKRINSEIVDEQSLKNVISYLYDAKEKELELANEELITIEQGDGIVVINSCYGNKINRTLGKIIGYLISFERGKGIRLFITPYNIIFLSKNIDAKIVESSIKEIYLRDIDSLLHRILTKDDSLVRYRFLHVAKRFGIIKHDVSVERKILEGLIAAYKNSPIFEETIKEILSKDLDLDGLKNLARKIGKNKIKIKILNKLSKLSSDLLKFLPEYMSHPLQSAQDKFIIELFKTRLLNKPLTVVCTDCWEYIDEILLLNTNELICPYCNSKNIAISKLEFNKMQKIIEKIIKKEKNRKVRMFENKLKRIANIIRERGKIAMVAFASNASIKDTLNLLNKYKEESEEFYLSLVKAESERLKRLYAYFKKKYK